MIITRNDIDKNDIQALENALEQAGAKIRGRSVLCPFHDDNTPSGGIYQGEGGWRFKCQVCQVNYSVIDVLAHVHGVEPGEILMQARKDGSDGHRMARSAPKTEDRPKYVSNLEEEFKGREIYTYHNQHGACLKVVRIEKDGKKKFLQLTKDEAGRWVYKNLLPINPIFAWKVWQHSDYVFVCEGEKAAKALLQLDIAATTSPGGALKAHLADWSMLAGKTVIIWPDHDENGYAHAGQVSNIVQDIAMEVIQIDPSRQTEPEAKDDAYDYIARLRSEGLEDAAIRQCILELGADGNHRDDIGSKLDTHIDDIIGGKMRPITTPWPIIDYMAGWLRPKDITVFVGSPSAGKSTFLLHLMKRAVDDGEAVRYIALEKDEPWWAMRLLNLKCQMPELEDPKWGEEHPEQLQQLYDLHRGFISSIIRRAMHITSGQTYDSIIDKIELFLKSGTRLIILDPITALDNSEKIFVVQQAFFSKLSNLLKEYYATAVIVNHTKQKRNCKLPDAGDAAGSTSLHNFTDSMVWLDRMEYDEYYTIDPRMEHVSPLRNMLNRRMCVLKARSGRGDGAHLGMYFRKDMHFDCHGIIRYGKGQG